ncbi:DUF1653 domain-containing protein [Patescibacteria group bacterium]|nr:DUF1653 domain-containing protein [Patescibacteria group bacterium]
MSILGKYKHYKGGLYEVIGEGIDSENLEEVIIYKSLYKNDKYPKNTIWVRPKKMFLEKIIINGEEIFRFTKIN